jgi:hypothetical protein
LISTASRCHGVTSALSFWREDCREVYPVDRNFPIGKWNPPCYKFE